MDRSGVKILEARVGIESNSRELLPRFPLGIEVKSLLTDYKEVEEIPYSARLDGYISLCEDESAKASYDFSQEKVFFKGPLKRLTEGASDSRFSLWGNQGFLFRYTLFLLERSHRIFNFHGCALYHEEKHRLYLVIGGAGSGKTVYLLSGIEKGLKLYSTEIVHFRLREGDVEWYMGSLVDNVRLGTLAHHFPQFKPKLDVSDKQDEWETKIALDLSSHKTAQETLANPEVVMVFPRIEEGRDGFLLHPVVDRRKAAKILFDNISQKISETVILYDTIPVVGFDDRKLAGVRLNSVNQLAQHPKLKMIAAVLTNPYECWGDLLEIK